MFVDLTHSTLHMVAEPRLYSRPLSMYLIKGQFYIGTEKYGLEVFDENLKQIVYNQLAHLGPINGFAPLLNEILVVAADSGLFLFNQQGKA